MNPVINNIWVSDLVALKRTNNYYGCFLGLILPLPIIFKYR